MSAVVRHVVDSISPASEVFAAAARDALGSAGVPMLADLAARLAGAQHGRPRVARRTLVICAGDHGAGDPGISLGPSHPTAIAAHAIADGTAAVAAAARTGRAPIVLVDAGAAERAAMPGSAVQLGRGPTRNLLREPAMTIVDATLGLEAGIALAVSLSETGLDVVALGAIGLGSELSTAAVLAAVDPAAGHPDDADLGAAFDAGARQRGTGTLEMLAALGGPETPVLAGLILGAASMQTPVILDGDVTCAAALVAVQLAPAAAGYLIAAHTVPLISTLGLSPLYGVGLGHGEGTGAAMALPLLDQLAALSASR